MNWMDSDETPEFMNFGQDSSQHQLHCLQQQVVVLGEDEEDLLGDLEEYLNSYHYTLHPDDPGYEIQRRQRIRNQPYFELTYFLEEGEKVQQALQRLAMIAYLKKEKENQRKVLCKETKVSTKYSTSSSRMKEKNKVKKPINFSRLTNLVRKLEQLPGNEDIMNADLGFICKKITEPLVLQ